MPHLSLTNPLLDLWGVFFRHKLKCIAFVTVSLVLVLAGIVICPRKYGSEAKLLIKIGRENVALDPTEAVGQTMQVYHTREEEVNSVVEVMKSRRIAELVVEKIGADEILGKPPTSALAVSRESTGNFSLTAWLGGLAAPISRMDPVNDRERAIRHLKKRIGISAPRTTDVVSITYAASTPKLAQRVVQAWADVFMDEHVRLHRNEGSYEFFVEQEKLLQQQFDEATTALSTAKNEFGIVTVPGQQRILERQIEETERNILFKTTQLAASDAKIRALQERVADLDERVVVEEVQGVTNDAKDGMRQQLYELEIRERELLSKYLPGHPLVRAVQSQRRESENILSNQQEKTQSTKALNPTRQALQMQLLQEESQAESLRAETELLSRQRETLQKRLKMLNGQEVQIAHLQQSVDVLSTKYAAHSQNLELARMNDALEKKSFTSVSVVHGASLEEKPVSPRKGVVLVLGTIAALLGGAGLVFLAEYLDQSFNSASQIEQQVKLPVLIAIPRTPRHRVMLS